MRSGRIRNLGLIFFPPNNLLIIYLFLHRAPFPHPPTHIHGHWGGCLEWVTTWGLESWNLRHPLPSFCGLGGGIVQAELVSPFGYCRRKGNLGTPIKVAIPRGVDWQAGRQIFSIKALLPQLWAGRNYFDGGVICRLLREMKGVHLHWAICRVSRGCCMSLLPQGEGNVGIIAKE